MRGPAQGRGLTYALQPWPDAQPHAVHTPTLDHMQDNLSRLHLFLFPTSTGTQTDSVQAKSETQRSTARSECFVNQLLRRYHAFQRFSMLHWCPYRHRTVYSNTRSSDVARRQCMHGSRRAPKCIRAHLRTTAASAMIGYSLISNSIASAYPVKLRSPSLHTRSNSWWDNCHHGRLHSKNCTAVRVL